MAEITLIFPHQLFAKHPSLKRGRPVFLLEDDLFFSHYKFHLQKLWLHRASLQQYQQFLEKKGFEVTLITHEANTRMMETSFRRFSRERVDCIHLAEPTDYLLRRRLERYSKQFKLPLEYSASPNFINTMEEHNQYFSSRKRYFLTEFYIDQRKKHQLLLNANRTPQGGKWTYDQENRKKLPKNLELPPSPVLSHPKEQFALLQQLQAQYPQHYGEVAPPLYAINYAQAGKVLDQFLEQRFRSYGTYQDALHPGQSFLFHSLISPALNIGLLDPLTIVKQVIDYAQQEKIPINQTEGFVRQILGWREFLRAVYEREGVKERTRNFWGFKESMPKAFWTGTTGIPPVDQVIHRLLQTGYSHHIERLMVLGNFMCLCEIDPDAVYEWFMTMYIDAYDWVMVPNVYGMSQFADGGLMSTKPYISGSNYILKMSSYPKGDWCAIWDALFWRFLYRHKTFFKTNPRLSMLLGHLDRMSAETKKSHFRTADQFLQKLYA